MARKDQVGEFEGDPVIRSEIAVTKIGDGLSDALKVDPVTLHRGDTVYLVVEAEVRHVAFPPVEKGSDRLARKHVLDAVNVALVDAGDVRTLLEQSHVRVQAGLDSIAGQQSLDVEADATKAAKAAQGAAAKADTKGEVASLGAQRAKNAAKRPRKAPAKK